MNTKNKTTLKIDGMTCHSCVTHVTRALRDIEGVTGADVDLRQKQAIVEHDADGPSVATLLAALRDAGYDGSVMEPVASTSSTSAIQAPLSAPTETAASSA